ncbi:MAG TPA: dienelactone hydrolase family protein [Fimbriimonadaceae bacterium]|nr:dienelactone hydrolase family protein [Fimbriimonadaceae bacterium]
MLCALAFTLLAQQKPSCCSGMNQFLSDPAFIAAHLPPAPVKFQSKEGRTVLFKTTDGRNGQGFFVPAKKGNDEAILMFHEWWGLNDNIRENAVTLHNELGAAVLAVDLYDGQVTADPQKAGQLMGKMNEERGIHLVDGALKAIQNGAIAKAKSIGTIGWCFGGGWSHKAAIEGGKDVQACVIYYGMPSTDPADLGRLQAPVLMFWGTQDGFINSKVVSGFEEAMKKAGKSLKTHSFDAPHAFANPSNPKYNPEATKVSHAETLAFFKEHLK